MVPAPNDHQTLHVFISSIIQFDKSCHIVVVDFQQNSILTCVDLNEPLQPPFKLRNSKWCSVSSLTIIEYSSD